MALNKLKNSHWISIGLLLMLLIMHIPFIEADPDRDISFSRGPFTDEGLNSIQIRNLLDHGYLDLAECDNFLKTPLFNLTLAVPYALFGTNLETGRLAVLLLTLVIIFFMSKAKEMRIIIPFFIIITLLQYQVFQFTHFALAEILSSSLILLSIALYLQARIEPDEKISRRKLAAAVIILSLSYYFKIQFIYIIFLPLVTILFEKAFGRWKPLGHGILRTVLLWTAIPAFVYLVGWYLPSFTTYNHMMVHQSGTFGISGETIDLIEFNLREFFLKGPSLYLTILFLLMLFLSILLYRNGATRKFKVLLPAALAWNLLELHKILMVYLPTRYQLSLLVSIGFTISLILAEAFEGKSMLPDMVKKIFRYSAVFIVMSVLILQVVSYQKTLSNRTFEIREVNRYLASCSGEEDTVIGAWAPSFTWKSNSRSFPVWNGFLNFQDPLNSFHPRAIVSEPDEEDSNQAYLHQSIDLNLISDSVKTFKIGLWDVNIYWVKQ